MCPIRDITGERMRVEENEKSDEDRRRVSQEQGTEREANDTRGRQ